MTITLPLPLADQITQLATAAAVPLAAVALGFASFALNRAATWLHTKTRNELLYRVTAAASTVAGHVSDTLAALPPGTPLKTARTDALFDATHYLQLNFPVAIGKLGLNSAALTTLISGELGKLNAINPSVAALQPSVQPVPPSIALLQSGLPLTR